MKSLIGNIAYIIFFLILCTWIGGIKFLKFLFACFAIFGLIWMAFGILINVLVDLEENIHIFSKSFNFLGHEINAFKNIFGALTKSIQETDSKVIKFIIGILIIGLWLILGALYLLAQIFLILVYCVPLFLVFYYFK